MFMESNIQADPALLASVRIKQMPSGPNPSRLAATRGFFLVVSGYAREDRIEGVGLIAPEGNFYVSRQHGQSEEDYGDALKLVGGAQEISGDLSSLKRVVLLSEIQDRILPFSEERLTGIKENLAVRLVASQTQGTASVPPAAKPAPCA